MGWAAKHLSDDQRRAIAETLFTVTDETSDGWLNGHCPLHDDQTSSFGYNYLKDVFKCLAACVDSGDLVKLYSLINGLDDREGFSEFKAKYASSEGTHTEKAPRKVASKPSLPAAPPAPSPAGTSAGPTSISDELWNQFPQLSQAWIDRLARERGWTSDALAKLDVRLQTFLRRRTGEVTSVKKPERIAIPVRDQTGQLRNIRLYKPWDRQPQDQKIISWGKGFGSSALFPPAPLPSPGPVLLCEGEPDTICAIAHGFNAITQTGKPTTWVKEQLEVFRDRDVIIAYDEDVPGHNYSQHAAKNLAAVARSVRILRWPACMRGGEGAPLPEKGGQDLTDFFVKHGKTTKDLEILFSSAEQVQKPASDQLRIPHEFFAVGESGRSSFKPSLLVRRIMEDVSLLYDPKTGLLYRYNGRTWELIPLEFIQRLAINYLGLEAKKGCYTDVADQVRVLSSIEPDRDVNDRPDYVCLENGLFNLRTFELIPHDKNYYATYKLGVSWEMNKTKPPERWLKFLEETIQDQAVIDQVQEFFGLALTRETRFAKALLLYGPGSDGKSVLLKILMSLIGYENCSSVSFKDLEDQFHRASLYNKLLNVATEIGGQALESPYFKAIVTGDSISASFKHQTPFQFRPFCKLAYSCNKLPRVLDNSDGYFRRLLLVEFKRQFKGDDEDKGLEEKLLAELNGIFEWSVLGLARLRERGRFEDSESGKNLLMSYKRLNNPTLCFVEDECVIQPDADVGKDEIYGQYKSYCSRNGYTALNKENFFRELRAAVTTLRDWRPRAEGERTRRFKGIGLMSTEVAA